MDANKFPQFRWCGAIATAQIVLRCALIMLAIALLPLFSLSASDAQDLIKAASEGRYFTPNFLDVVAPLRGGAVNKVLDAEGRTMLHWTAVSSNQARTLVLLLLGADVNARDSRGRTPVFDVMEAVSPYPNREDHDFMNLEMLAAKGADLNARADDGTTPLAIAAERGDYRKAEFLIWRGAEITPTGVQADKLPLNIARAKNDVRMINMLEAALKGMNATESNGKAATRMRPVPEMLTAAELNAVEVALDNGWNINEQDEKGRTALYRAVNSCRGDLTSLLLFEGADPNIAANDGRTPLMESMRFINNEGQRLAGMLLLKGANVNAVAKNGDTPLTSAAATGYDFGVQWLICAGADPCAKTPKGSVTDYCTHPMTLALLKHLGAPDKSRHPQRRSPRRSCVKRRAMVIWRRYRALEGGTLPDAEQNDGNWALSCAANNNHFEVVDFLLSHRANINKQNGRTGWHPLHFFAEWGRTRGSRRGGNIHQEASRSRREYKHPDENRNDALMCAAKQGVRGENTEALLKAGARSDLRNKEGLTALGVAKNTGAPRWSSF